MRRRPDRFDHPLTSYRERFKTFPETVEATGEDAVLALYRMKSGAMVQFSYVAGGRGSHVFERSVHGRRGALHAPGDRNGRPVILHLEGQEIQGQDILPLLSDFQLSEITERLFGRQVVQYELPWPSIDAKHMAIEFHDFAEAILTGCPPEVDGYLGMTAVAAILGAYESALAGRVVSMEELLSGAVQAYQADVNAVLGLER